MLVTPMIITVCLTRGKHFQGFPGASEVRVSVVEYECEIERYLATGRAADMDGSRDR